MSKESPQRGLSFEKDCGLLQRIRCERAAAMLRETGDPVSAIIRKVGYQNESFFRTAFRAVYGKTPLQYRKEDRGGYYDE